MYCLETKELGQPNINVNMIQSKTNMTLLVNNKEHMDTIQTMK